MVTYTMPNGRRIVEAEEEAQPLAELPVVGALRPAPLPAARIVEAPAAPAPSGPPRLTWEQFLWGQLAPMLSVAVVLGLIAYVAVSFLPASALPARRMAPAAVPAASAAPAFTSETVAQQVQVGVRADNPLKWDQPIYTAQVGDVSFVVTNSSAMPHNFAIEGNGIKVQSKDFGANAKNTFTLKGLPAGEYTIVCNVPGHREAGMVAKLIVK
jgi:plastocyanin